MKLLNFVQNWSAYKHKQYRRRGEERTNRWHKYRCLFTI